MLRNKNTHNHVSPQVQITLGNWVTNPMFILPAYGLLVGVTVCWTEMEFYDCFPVLTALSKVGVRHSAE